MPKSDLLLPPPGDTDPFVPGNPRTARETSIRRLLANRESLAGTEESDRTHLAAVKDSLRAVVAANPQKDVEAELDVLAETVEVLRVVEAEPKLR